MAYSPVYSAQFILYSASSPNEQFQVPAGYTAVVRQISYFVEASASFFSVNVANSSIAPETAIDGRTITGLLTSEHVSGHWVVPGGGFIVLYVQDVGSQPTVYVGGYLLTNSVP